MKLITKPIRKGTNEIKSSFKASALATAVLAGTIALTASGCTAEIKTADGKPIGTVVINGEEVEALASGIAVNQTNPDDIIEPSNVSVPDVFTHETEETENTPEETSEPSKSGEINETDPAPTKETTAAPTATATPSTVPTKADTNVKPSLNNIKEGEVIKLIENKNGNFSASGIFGNISVNHTDNSDVEFRYNGHAFIGSVSSVKWSDVYLFKNNGKTFIYIEVVRGCMNNELNIYEVSDTYVKNGGVVKDFCLSIFSNTKSFKGYDGGPSSGNVLAERMFRVSDSGRPVPADNYSYLGTDKVYAKKTMTGYIVRDGKVTSEKVTIYSGEPVEPKALNEVEYIDFKYGTDIVRVDFTNECCTYYDQNDYRWIFKAVNSMVSPVYAKPQVRFLDEGAVYEFNYADQYRSLWASGKYGDFYIICRGEELQKCNKIPLFYDVHFWSQKYDNMSTSKIYETIIDAKSVGDDLMNVILKNPTRKELRDNNMNTCRGAMGHSGNFYFISLSQLAHCDLFDTLEKLGINDAPYNTFKYSNKTNTFYYYDPENDLDFDIVKQELETSPNFQNFAGCNFERVNDTDFDPELYEGHNPLTEWMTYGINWTTDMSGLGSVGAIMDCKYFFFMYPNQFLNLCPKFSYGDEKFFNNYILSRKPVGIPFLWYEVYSENKTIKVFDHEGRHRVKAIRDYALKKTVSQPDIPVAIIYNKDKNTRFNRTYKIWNTIKI